MLKSLVSYAILISQLRSNNSKTKRKGISTMKRKLKQGDEVMFQSKKWMVCEGGRKDTKLKSFRYKLRRGSLNRLVPGNQIRSTVTV